MTNHFYGRRTPNMEAFVRSALIKVSGTIMMVLATISLSFCGWNILLRHDYLTEVSLLANMLLISNKISINKNKQIYFFYFFFIFLYWYFTLPHGSGDWGAIYCLRKLSYLISWKKRIVSKRPLSSYNLLFYFPRLNKSFLTKMMVIMWLKIAFSNLVKWK